MWNTHERDGKPDQVSEKVPSAVDTPTGDDDVDSEGAEEMTGKVESAIGRTLREAADAITHAGRAAKE